MISRLACSLSVKDGEEVARLLVTDVEGNVRTEKILAGRDSSEWAYDCSNIKPQIQHSRAQVFSSFPTKMYDESCLGHFYVTKINFPDTKAISSVEIQWTGHSGSITIDKLSLINEATNKSEAVNPLSIEGSQWRYLAEAGEARIYENPQALPRAWLASEVKQLKPEDILSAIKTSKLPDGSSFNPARTALVEEPISTPAQTLDPASAAQITQFSNTSMEVQTSSSVPTFLVTSDVYYPGWRASLDGAPVQLFRANYTLRGVQVPAGKHLVRFEFRFRTFYYGAAISALSLLALIGFLTLAPLFPKRSKQAM